MEAHQQLEIEFARWNGLEPAQMVACSSGTAALHLALETVNHKSAKRSCREVLVPDFTMIACARAVVLAGLKPVFIDCGEDLLLSPEVLHDYAGNQQPAAKQLAAKQLAANSCGSVVALMVVHIYGRRCDMNKIQDFAVNHGIDVIEDLAEAHGIPPHPCTAAACWSFYRNKIVAGEEGGAVWFRDPESAAHARELRTLGFTEAHDFIHTPRGHNYRMSEAHARLIIESLRTVGQNIRERRRIETEYSTWCPPEWRMPPRNVPWVYDIRIPGLDRSRQARIVAALNAEGIAARMSFFPMSEQPEFKTGRDSRGSRAWKASQEVFYLPIQPGRTTKASVRKSYRIIHNELSNTQPTTCSNEPLAEAGHGPATSH